LPKANDFAFFGTWVPAFGFIFYGEPRHKRIQPQSGLMRKYGFVFGMIYKIALNFDINWTKVQLYKIIRSYGTKTKKNRRFGKYCRAGL
jgi:hypothetical protein